MKVSVRRWTALLTIAALLMMAGCAKREVVDSSGETQASNRSLVIGYAEDGVVVAQNERDFSRSLFDAMGEAEDSIALEYQNDAFSNDGVHFSCYIANSLDNPYDMFIQVFADENFQDELFLSQLLRPGQAFERLELNHALPSGVTTVYVALTQVEVVDGQQMIHAQTFVTMDFTVY
jgi:hypothetical protein